jgi:hypothetical protein
VSYFTPREPSLDELIAYAVARALDREAVLTKTKLVKLLYLIDVETWRSERRLLTNLDWVFLHYGPYTSTLNRNLDRLEGQQLVWKEFSGGPYERTILYTRVLQPPSGDSWPVITKLRADRVIDRWAPEPLELLLDFVYFETEPMLAANRGESLDFSTIVHQRVEARPPPVRVNEAIRGQLREVVAEQMRMRAGLEPTTPPRYDEVWEEAMSIEERLREPPDLTGSILLLTDDAAASFAAATDE